MKKTVSVFLTLIFVLTSCQLAFAAEAPKFEETKITGISSTLSASRSKKLTRTVKITPAQGGRTVYLQLYRKKYKKYKTIKTYKTEDTPTAKVKISFPKKWRKRRTGKWRIVVLKTKTAARAVKNTTVTSKNIVNKKLTCKTACVYCVEDKVVVYGLKINERRKQASTTKIMTSTLLLESGKFGDNTTISQKAADTLYSHPVMKAGDIYTNKSLLYTMLLPSSNGSAVATAETVAGSESAFVKMMNGKADEIGLKNTHFKNPHGLDESGHYSSAYDLSLQMAYIYPKSKNFRKALLTKTYTFTTKKYNLKYTVDTTDTIREYKENHKGGKTGTTSGAGCCYVSVYTCGDKTYTVSVMGAPDDNARFSNAKKLYSYIDEYADTSY